MRRPPATRCLLGRTRFSGSALGHLHQRRIRIPFYGKPACFSAEVVLKAAGTRSSPSSK